jgi:hypothetical protein
VSVTVTLDNETTDQVSEGAGFRIDQGHLLVGDGTNDVAVFAPGAWLSAVVDPASP